MFMRLMISLILLLQMTMLLASTVGELNLYVFKNALPHVKYQVVLDGKHFLITGVDGVASTELVSGEHFIEFSKNDDQKNSEAIRFYIESDETTNVSLNLFSDQKSDVEVSEPEAKKVATDGSTGYLVGQVRSLDGQGVAKASVFIQGIDQKIKTDEQGQFKTQIPTGRFIISVVHSGYRTSTVRNIEIKKNTTSKKIIEMEPSGLELDDFVVVAPHVSGSLAALVEVRRQSSKVADVMGSEQMSKAGDSNAAASLARVTGLTIVDGKYVYIRGLGERYSNVLLNNTTLPSPDPTRRVVQLDMFPSGILQNLTVQKSYSPDLPGDFGGGTVVMQTKDIPEEFVAKVSLSTTYESGNNRVVNYQGGTKDWLGMDDGTRALPASIADATRGGKRLSAGSAVSDGYSKAQLQSFSKDMPRLYNTSEESAPLPPSLSLSLGDLYKFKGRKFGFLMAGMYSNRWDNDDRLFKSYQGDGSPDRERDVKISEQTVNLSGMLNFGLKLGRGQDISTNTMILRKTTNRIARTEQSSQSDEDANLRSIELEWQERQLFTQLIKGTHRVGDDPKRLIKWRGAYSQALRDQPDTRSFEQDLTNGEYVTAVDGKRNEKFYNQLADVSQDYALSFDTPVWTSENLKLSVKLGGQYTTKKRESENKRFKYSNIDVGIAESVTGDSNIQRGSIQNLCSNEVIDLGGCLLEDVTAADDRYEARQEIRAYFVDSETKIYDFLRLNAGVRVEESRQDINTYAGTDRNLVSSGLVMNDILPVVGLTFFTSKQTQLRLAYSETVSRPDFKDLNPGKYFDDERRRLVNGNLNLKGTIIKNLDARFEWYFGNNENFSLGAFQKEFVNPIEEVSGAFNNEGQLASSEGNFQLANVGDAKSYGFEVEFRKDFAFINDSFKDLSFGANYSYIASELSIFSNLAGQVTNQVRALQGQSPYVVNANLSYDNQDSGTIATVLYNVFGRRIDAVGTKPFDDVFEEKFHRLDAVFSQQFMANNIVNLKVQNILDPNAVLTESGLVRQIYRKGRTISLGFSRTF
jgi:hypothetical protein